MSYLEPRCRTDGNSRRPKRKDGSTGYTAQTLIKRSGVIVHPEAQTFHRRPAATLWTGKL